MIKVSVMYPHREDAKFDMDYYQTHHMPMVKDRLGRALQAVSIDEGIGGAEPGAPPAFAVIAHLHFDSVEAFQKAFAPHAAEIAGDIINYTDVEPIVQVSEVRA